MNHVNWEKPKSCIGMMKEQRDLMEGYRDTLLYLPAPNDGYNGELTMIKRNLDELKLFFESLEARIEDAEADTDDDPEARVPPTQHVADDAPEQTESQSTEDDPEALLQRTRNEYEAGVSDAEKELGW